MSHFTVFLPAVPGAVPRPASFESVGATLRGTLREDEVTAHEVMGAHLLVSGSVAARPAVRRTATGWVAAVGSLLDLGSSDGTLDAEALLELLQAGDEAGLARYEGTFALAAWHGPTRTGWLFNDQTSALNCYYGELDGGFYATTCALALARALKLGLDPQGVCELFARGTVLAPTSMFAGLRRLDVGEHVCWRGGAWEVGTHWTPYRTPENFRSTSEAASAISTLAVDRIRRYASPDAPVVSDLTGGYDSRLVVSAAHAADRLAAVTVDGPDDDGDVRVAKRVAAAMGWDLQHFDTERFWDVTISGELRRELTYRTGGELPFTEVYHHYLSRPVLARRFRLHLTGGGGELMRSFPWSQEFAGIGKRRTANVENLLRYRFFQEGPPREGLFRHDWHPRLVDRFRERAAAILAMGGNSLTTQQLDAAYLWRMTGFSPYTTAVHSWLPSVAPLMCAGVLEVALAVPWRLRLTSRLVRTMTHTLAPRAADLTTRYGGTAGPTRPGNAHRAAWQQIRQSYHLLAKIDRVKFGGRLTRLLGTSAGRRVARKPYLTEEFRAFLDPREMFSAALYDRDGLAQVLSGPPDDWYSRESLILRIATIEQLCRELDTRPDPDTCRL